MEQIGVKNDLAKLQQLLGSKLYSNKYSFISEALQNSTDAMRKCGKEEEPFDVIIKQENNEFLFQIRDYGCSFDSIERFKELMTLLESSKSQNKDNSENQEMGKYGIGSVAVSAYNKKWSYKVYKNGKGFNAFLEEIDGKGIFIECSDYFETDEQDGVLFSVKINTPLEEFLDNLIFKAKYFQNIKFNFSSEVSNQLRRNYYSNYKTEDLFRINEKFVIYKSEDFQYSTLNKDDEMHICIDQYTYAIDWKVLDLKPVSLPIALKFKLNDFETNPTREVLTITTDYKEKVVNKIRSVANWFLNKYNEQNPIFECKDIKEFKENLEKRKYKTVKIGEKELEIEKFVKEYAKGSFNSITFKDSNEAELNKFVKFMSMYWNSFYKLKFKLIYSTVTKSGAGSFSWENMFLLDNGSLKQVYREYLKQKSSRFYFYTKNEKEISAAFKENCCSIAYSEGYYIDKDIPEDTLKEFEKLKDRFILLKEEFEKACFWDIESYVPKEWINSRPKRVINRKPKLEKSEGEVILKYPRRPDKSTGWYAVWEDKSIKIKDLGKQAKFHIYSTEENRRQLEWLFKKFQTKNLQIIMVNEKNQKILDNNPNHNFVNIKDLKNRFEVLSKYVTVSIIKESLKDNEILRNYIWVVEDYISTEIGKDLRALEKLLKDYSVDNLFYLENSPVIPELIEFYRENPKMLNAEMLFLYNKVGKVLEKLDFIKLFAPYLKNNDNKFQISLKTLRELCKSKQIRMNWENYKFDKIEEHFNPIEIVELEPELV